MRVMVLEPDPSHGGGSEAVVLSVARGLASRGHEIVLLHDAHGSMMPDYGAFAVETLQRRLPGFAKRSPITTARGMATIVGAVRRSRAQTVVSSHLGYLRHAAVTRRVLGVPFLFHLGLPCVGDSFLLQWSYRNLGTGVAPSEHNAATWSAGGWPDAAMRVVPNWVDVGTFAPAVDRVAARRAVGLPSDGRYVLFLGRICEQKGVTVLLRAFAGLGPGYEDVKLLLVGAVAPGYGATLDASLGAMPDACRARVIVHPVTAQPERYYQAADVACVPSLGDEAFGLTVVEAMACGVPVLTSALGMTHELLGPEHAALLREPGVVKEWVSGLRKWLDDADARGRCGASLRKRAVEQFGPGPGVAAYEAVLEGMLEIRVGGRA
ncbi:MAG: glycosyltransferase family 4 protein [Chloroflexota bacterium]|nr:glycosyltransferase family 4 protein [Chloroflexota bacterium]